MIATTNATEAKTRQRPAPEPLQVAIEPDKWYWTASVAKSFKMSRLTIAEMKRAYPEHVGRSRNGDILQGIAVINWLTGKRKQNAPAS